MSPQHRLAKNTTLKLLMVKLSKSDAILSEIIRNIMSISDNIGI